MKNRSKVHVSVHSSSIAHCNRRSAAPRAQIAAQIGSLDAPENCPHLFFNSLSENLGWKLMQFNFTVGVRGSISNVDRTEPLSFLSTLRALGITSKANLEKIRKVTAKRAFEAHDLLLRSYYAAKSSPSRTDFSAIAGNTFALQHRLRPPKLRSR